MLGPFRGGPIIFWASTLIIASVWRTVASDDPPRITDRPRDQQVRAGGIATFLCKAAGDPPPQLQWRKNGKRLSGTQSRYLVHDFPGGGGALLRIEPVRSGRDDANYECVAENGVGDAVSSEAVLTVYESEKLPAGFPRVAQAPGTKVVEVGHTAVLQCEANGSPPPRVIWVRDMLPVETSNPRYTVLEAGSLQITSSEEEDQGKYECVAENVVGTEFSHATMLYVKVRRVPPQFSIPPRPLHEVMLGADLNITCVAVGSPMPFVKWRQSGGAELTPEDQLPIGRNVLVLEDIRLSANYTCVAASALGVIEASTLVKVQSLPSAPTSVKISEVTATSVRLTWSYPENEEIQYYVIQYKPKYANQAFSEISGVITMYYTVRGLSPYTEYELYVIAVNSIGRGPPSTPALVTTGETADSAFGGAKPGTAPRNVQVRPLSSSTMVIQWDEPETPNGQITGYKVYYTMNPGLQMSSWKTQIVDNNQLTTISDLTPHTIYTIRVQALTSVAPGPLSAPVQIKTQQGVPSQPSNLRASDVGETTVTLQWNRPSHSGENIISYELYWNDTYAKEKHHRRIPVIETYTLTDLYPNTLYYVWLAARSQRGEGATTSPTPIRTKQYVPGDPQEVKVTPLNSTSVRVDWKPPLDKDRNGLIRGYHVHVQEMREEGKSLLNDPLRFDVLGDAMETFNVTGLQPDTKYSVQVAALTRKGDGDRSPPEIVRTPGGVPNRPTVNVKILEREPAVTIELEWSKPSQAYGELQGYRVRYGVRDQSHREEVHKSNQVTTHRIEQLERGVEYEFRIAGQNQVGYGQETIKYLLTPEGPPTGAPVNVSYHFQTPDIVSVSWAPPSRDRRNGQLTKYTALFHKKNDNSAAFERNTTQTKVVFTDLEEHTEYVLQVRAHTQQGPGPYSERITLRTERDIVRAPMSVKAIATSDSSVEVWWESVPSRGKVIGYQIFYTMTAVEDLDEWQQKSVGPTESADLTSLEKYAQYALAVAARTKSGLGRLSEKVTVKVKPEDVPLNLRAYEVSTHSMTLSWSPPIRLNPINYKITFDASKEFVDSQGITQMQTVPRRTILLEPSSRSYTINELSPFTTYSVNVSAIPADHQYRPPAKIAVTTQMAGTRWG